MDRKYLAYITPLADIEGKDYVDCLITFITGDLNHQTFKYAWLRTDIFRFYYYGSTLEVVELDGGMRIVSIRDLTKEDAEEFGVSLKSVVTLNSNTFDMLVSNDVTYNMKENKFYRHCSKTVDNMLNRMKQIDKFVLRAYIINGAVIYLELDEIIKNSNNYVMSPGFVVNDRTKLKNNNSFRELSIADTNEKLNQEDIDKIVTRLVS